MPDIAAVPGRRREVRGVVKGRFTVTCLHHSGVRPHRLLLIGSRALLAPPGRAHSEAMGQRVADRIWLRTRRGVDVDMLWELRPVLSAIRGGLSSWRLWRYDAVVVVLSARPSTFRARWVARGAGRLLRRVIGEVASASHVLLVSLDDEPGREHGRRSAAGSVLAGIEADVPGGAARVSSFSASSDPRTGSEAIAQQLMAPLAAADAAADGPGIDGPHRRRLQPDEEAGRQRAVDELVLGDPRMERRLQHVVDLAQDAFESASAEITIIDHDRQWTLAAAGHRRDDAPRRTSLCSRSIERPAPTVIADTWHVPDLRGDPLLVGPVPIRFSASHPIESIDGYRIGVLCVWDDVEALDVAALRDLALLAEAEIISMNEDR